MQDFADRLLNWFDQHGRKDLPWQKDISPYRVWISEIMLQQTQVATVIPYFERFMDRFPSMEVLATAATDKVLHQWTGLGYYARARNLHKTAQMLMQERNGEWPLSVDELQQLPGIGRSTAGAIVSVCTGKSAPILDGNVKRVLARVFAIEGWPGKSSTLNALWEKAEALTPEKRVRDYTQAIMDLGAIVCTRSSPDCPDCPFSDLCEAKLTDSIARHPGKKPKKILPVRSTTMLVIESNHQLLLEKRPPTGLWGGLWSFPEQGDREIDELLEDLGLHLIHSDPLPEFRHSFTHFHLDVSPLRLIVRDEISQIHESDQFYWFDITRPAELGLTRPVTKVLETLHST